jgi:hypothetical protein
MIFLAGAATTGAALVFLGEMTIGAGFFFTSGYFFTGAVFFCGGVTDFGSSTIDLSPLVALFSITTGAFFVGLGATFAAGLGAAFF